MAKKIRIVFTTGTWDLLHSGHLNILKQAKKAGRYLIVGVSTNALIKKYKGIDPVMSYTQRKEIIESIRFVDEVVKQDNLLSIKQFKDLNIDLFILGDDWKNKKNIPGLTWLKKNNKIKFVPYTKALSSTSIKKKILKNAYEIIEAQIKR